MCIIEKFIKASKESGGDIHKAYEGFRDAIIDCKISLIPISPMLVNNIVLIGGGSGTTTVGRSLYEIGITNFTTIASVMDVGGGSGVVQNVFGVPHLNDLAQHLINMNPTKNDLSHFMNIRNNYSWRQDAYLVMAAMINVFGMKNGIDLIGYMLGNKHRSLFSTSIPCEPIFTYQGKKYKTYDFAFLDRNDAADFIKLNRPAKIFPEAEKVMLGAKFAIIGPGDVHFSVLPPIITEGFQEVLSTVHKIILVANLTARKIDIPYFKLSNFIDLWKRYLPLGPEYVVLANNSSIAQADPVLEDDIIGDKYREFYLYRAPIAGKKLSRNQQILHDEFELGNSLKLLLL